MNGQARPRQAATVILLRRIEPKGFEVFLTRRPEGMPFLGGMYCFPGGAVIREDYAPRMIERCRGLDAARVRATFGAQVSPRQARGFWIAAVRELFEETGVLLAVTASGARPSRKISPGPTGHWPRDHAVSAPCWSRKIFIAISRASAIFPTGKHRRTIRCVSIPAFSLPFCRANRARSRPPKR